MQGFISGGISSLASSGATGLKLGPAGVIVVGMVVGGLTAELTGGNFWQGLRQGFIISALNHVVHLASGGSGGGGDPPEIGDICIDECGLIQEFDGKGWVKWKPKITGTGQVLSTDSPIEWVLGAWRAPFQVADDLAVLSFARVPKGEVWVDAATGTIQKAGTFFARGKTYLKLLKDKIKTDFSKTNTSRGVPNNLPTPNPQPKSKYGPILDLIFGNFNAPK